MEMQAKRALERILAISSAVPPGIHFALAKGLEKTLVAIDEPGINLYISAAEATARRDRV
ncbi:MAG: hypothetical protein Q9167_007182 [Letrouitia subvulpina]